MPEESSLKRSRSPEPETQHANKRQNISTSPREAANDGKPSASTSSEHPPSTMKENGGKGSTSNEHATSSGDVAMTDSTLGSGTTASTATAAPASAAGGKEALPAPVTSASVAPAVPSQQIHLRCLIVTQDASIIIGKGGSHVNEIREKSGARVMVSESIPGNPERILNVSGALDAVSKAFGLIVRRINDEPFDVPSVPGSRAVTIKFIIPNSRMGSVIGKAGAKIKEIQDASGAKLNASEGMLPGSTERVLSVSGVADAIHIATYYVGNILIEAGALAPTSSNSSYRPSSGHSSRGPRTAPVAYGYGQHSSSTGAYALAPADPTIAQQTQQIFIPNDLVGCIIGKGGSKINEIRSMSASQIRIMEPGATPAGSSGPPNGERLVIITGAPPNVSMAVQLLYHRLETERQRLSGQAAAPMQ